MPRGPRRGFVGVRLSDQEREDYQAIADAEHDGNLSEAIRALLAEALQRRGGIARDPATQRRASVSAGRRVRRAGR